MPFLRKYNTLLVTGTTSIRIPIIKRSVVDFALGADWTPAAGDVKVFVDAAAVANITNLPTAIASGNGAFWEFILTAAELTCKQLLVVVSDAATKAVEDQSFIVETYGNASAMYAADLSLANLPANVTQILGTAVSTPATAGILDVNVKNIDNDAASASGTVTFPNATLASTTNITAGTIATVTNLTNAPTNGDLTATMKTSVTAAVLDADMTAHQTLGTLGQAIGDPVVDANTIFGAVVTGAAGATIAADIVAVQADTDNIQTRLPAALTAGGNMKTDTLYMNGAVWIDTVDGTAGTTSFVNGTLVNPCSTIASARTIADALILRNFMVANSSTITLDQGYNGYNFAGEKWTLALASQVISDSRFQGAIVSGLSTGSDYRFQDCQVGAVTVSPGLMSRCGLTDTITVGVAGVFIFDQCYGATSAGVDAIIDFAAVGATTVGLRNYYGGVEVRNMAAGDVLALTGNGRLTINANCTAGTVLVSGTINLVNNGSGQTITDTSRYNEDQSVALVNALATGSISSTTFAAAAIDAAAIAADAITSAELAQSAAQEIADEVLNRDIAGGGSGNTRNVRNALRAIRNKVSESAGTLTITQEDDVTPAWTAAVTRTANDPISGVDPT